MHSLHIEPFVVVFSLFVKMGRYDKYRDTVVTLV